MDPVYGFLTRLREVIHSRGLTQAGLAHSLGVREATVSSWFNSGAVPSGVLILRLPKLLEVDGHWLLTGEGEEPTFPGRSGAAEDPEIEGRRARIESLLEEALEEVRAEPGEVPLHGREASEAEKRMIGAAHGHRRHKRALLRGLLLFFAFFQPVPIRPLVAQQRAAGSFSTQYRTRGRVPLPRGPSVRGGAENRSLGAAPPEARACGVPRCAARERGCQGGPTQGTAFVATTLRPSRSRRAARPGCGPGAPRRLASGPMRWRRPAGIG